MSSSFKPLAPIFMFALLAVAGSAARAGVIIDNRSAKMIYAFHSFPLDPCRADSLQAGLVNDVHSLLVGRCASAEELRASQGKYPADIVAALMSGPDYVGFNLASVFEDVLHRAPSAADDLNARWRLAGNNWRSYAAQLYASPDWLNYQRRTQGLVTNADFVQALYGDILGRSATDAEVASMAPQILIARGAKAKSLLLSQEYFKKLYLLLVGQTVITPSARAMASSSADPAVQDANFLIGLLNQLSLGPDGKAVIFTLNPPSDFAPDFNIFTLNPPSETPGELNPPSEFNGDQITGYLNFKLRNLQDGFYYKELIGKGATYDDVTHVIITDSGTVDFTL